MGAISTKVSEEVEDRSNGVCERCGCARATEKAHLIRRSQIKHMTTKQDIAHLCTNCHRWADSGTDGRKWLTEFQNALSEG